MKVEVLLVLFFLDDINKFFNCKDDVFRIVLVIFLIVGFLFMFYLC